MAYDLSRSVWAAAIAMTFSLAMVGCGENPTSGLWDAALDVKERNTRQFATVFEQNIQDRMRQAHQEMAASLDVALQRYEGGDEGLRNVLTDIRDEQEQLGAGEITGAEAEELREQHEEYWSHLEDRELPPDYE